VVGIEEVKDAPAGAGGGTTRDGTGAIRRMTKAKAKDIAEVRCFSCQKPDSEVTLLEISLPKYIERNTYCPDCIAVLIDDSKKKGKASE
jgi:hypothetical protein